MTYTEEPIDHDCLNCLRNRIIHCTGGYYDTGRRWHCNSWDRILEEQAERMAESLEEQENDRDAENI